MEADVFVFDRSIDRLRELDVAFGGRCSTVYSIDARDRGDAARADLVIGAVLVHGRAAPHVITREQLALMKPQRGAGRRRDRPGRLLRDLAARPPTPTRPTRSTGSPTTASPTCPARCRSPRPTRSPTRPCPTSLALADDGVAGRDRARPRALRPGVNVAAGKVTHAPVAVRPATVKSTSPAGGARADAARPA